MRPLFSIVSVCLNNLGGLKRTRESLLIQTYRDFEWLVVDGASTDGTVKFLQSLEEVECRWVSEPDEGLYDAMNKGMEMASGQYLLFLNSGDELASSDVLEQVARVARESDFPALIYGDAFEKTQEGKIVLKPAYSADRIWYGMFTHHQAMFYRRDAVGKQRYRPEYRIAADYGFTCEFLNKYTDAVYMPLPVCLFEGGGITSSGNIHLRGMKEQWLIGREILRRTFAQRFFVLALHLAKHGLMRLAPSLYRRLRFREENHA